MLPAIRPSSRGGERGGTKDSSADAFERSQSSTLAMSRSFSRKQLGQALGNGQLAQVSKASKHEHTPVPHYSRTSLCRYHKPTQQAKAQLMAGAGGRERGASPAAMAGAGSRSGRRGSGSGSGSGSSSAADAYAHMVMNARPRTRDSGMKPHTIGTTPSDRATTAPSSSEGTSAGNPAYFSPMAKAGRRKQKRGGGGAGSQVSATQRIAHTPMQRQPLPARTPDDEGSVHHHRPGSGARPGSGKRRGDKRRPQPIPVRAWGRALMNNHTPVKVGDRYDDSPAASLPDSPSGASSRASSGGALPSPPSRAPPVRPAPQLIAKQPGRRAQVRLGRRTPRSGSEVPKSGRSPSHAASPPVSTRSQASVEDRPPRSHRGRGTTPRSGSSAVTPSNGTSVGGTPRASEFYTREPYGGGGGGGAPRGTSDGSPATSPAHRGRRGDAPRRPAPTHKHSPARAGQQQQQRVGSASSRRGHGDGVPSGGLSGPPPGSPPRRFGAAPGSAGPPPRRRSSGADSGDSEGKEASVAGAIVPAGALPHGRSPARGALSGRTHTPRASPSPPPLIRAQSPSALPSSKTSEDGGYGNDGFYDTDEYAHDEVEEGEDFQDAVSDPRQHRRQRAGHNAQYPEADPPQLVSPSRPRMLVTDGPSGHGSPGRGGAGTPGSPSGPPPRKPVPLPPRRPTLTVDADDDVDDDAGDGVSDEGDSMDDDDRIEYGGPGGPIPAVSPSMPVSPGVGVLAR